MHQLKTLVLELYPKPTNGKKPMPRTLGAKSKKKPTLAAQDFGDVKPIPFTAKGQELFDRISARWKLDDCAVELLTIACQNISEAERCHQVVQAEGYSYTSRFGEPKNHPLLKQEQQFLSSATTTLAKLHVSLG